MTTVVEWLRAGTYLPAPLRDFHDQKEVFKTQWQGTAKRIAADPSAASYLAGMNWVGAQVYVIDHFLWFMAAHGWTLQRSRFKPDDAFSDLHESVGARRTAEVESFKKMMADEAEKRRSPHDPAPAHDAKEK